MTPKLPARFPPVPRAPTRRASRSARGRAATASVILLVGLALGGCGGGGATFSPEGPCVADGRVAGAYPDLEALLPARLLDMDRESVDSGRSCTEAALGAFIAHDLHEVRYAGATFDLGDGRFASSVVFALPDRDLPADWVAEFYEIGARTAKRTENIETSRPTYPPTGRAWRLDTLNELTLQSVITWGDGAIARAVLVSTQVAPGASRDAHEALVAAALQATADAAAAAGDE